MNSPKHILFLTPAFPRNNQDTTRMTAVHYYVQHLKKQHPDISLTVITLQYPYERERYTWNEIEVVSLATPSNGVSKKVSSWPRVLRAFKRLHRANKVDVVHSFWLGECAVLGEYISRKWSVSHVCTNIGTELLNKNKYLLLLSIKRLNIICQSHFQQEVLQKKYVNSHSQIIPFGIEAPEVPVAADQERSTDLLFVGNLNPNKNLPMFLEVASFLIREGLNLKIKVIGDNVDKLDVHHLFKSFGIDHCTEYLGRVENKLVLKEMACAKILVHPSSFEAGAFVFMEALLQGMYIVSKEVGLVKEMSRWRIANDITGFSQIIRDILSNPREHKSLVPYSIEDTVDAYMRVYQTCMDWSQPIIK